MAMYEILAPPDSEQTASVLSTCSLVARRVSQLVRRVSEAATQTTAGSGVKPSELLGTLAPGGRYLKTQLAFAAFDTATGNRPLGELSPPYPRWGIASGGVLGALPTLERPIDEKEYSSSVDAWPTPSASLFNDSEDLSSWEARRAQLLATHQNGNGMGTPLAIAVKQAEPTWPTPLNGVTEKSHNQISGQWRDAMAKAMAIPMPAAWQTPATDSFRSRGGDRKNEMGLDQQARADWPTPTSQNAKHGAPTPKELEHRPSHLHVQAAAQMTGQLNPAWVETLMNLPLNWTDIAPVPKTSPANRTTSTRPSGPRAQAKPNTPANRPG